MNQFMIKFIVQEMLVSSNWISIAWNLNLLYNWLWKSVCNLWGFDINKFHFFVHMRLGARILVSLIYFYDEEGFFDKIDGLNESHWKLTVLRIPSLSPMILRTHSKPWWTYPLMNFNPCLVRASILSWIFVPFDNKKHQVYLYDIGYIYFKAYCE